MAKIQGYLRFSLTAVWGGNQEFKIADPIWWPKWYFLYRFALHLVKTGFLGR